MSEFMGDLSNYTNVTKPGTYKINGQTITIQNKSDNLSMDMTDFLSLMIAQLQNQGIDDTMDTSDMLNQMVQMQMVQALVNMTDASVMSYAASLVGKTVTVAKFDASGNLQELAGVVTGTGTLDGQQVIIVNDEYYYLSEILAVGTLPQKTEDAGGTEGDKPAEDIGGVEPGGDKEDPEAPDEGGGAVEPGGGAENTETPETPEYSGESGSPADTDT